MRRKSIETDLEMIDGGNSKRHKTATINISHVFKELGEEKHRALEPEQ